MFEERANLDDFERKLVLRSLALGDFEDVSVAVGGAGVPEPPGEVPGGPARDLHRGPSRRPAA